MQLIINKKNKKGETCTTITKSFNNFDDYYSFLELNGIFISIMDASMEFSQETVQYNLPLEL